ncbi:hypothetical protein [Saccharopolyspora spinosa]|uniref:Uncharacterized protein n=1 Tax=Saccharopolyspora spinosa TaxID=60894 RepID=A0A2N3XQW1_SACSN|nr:hypothetical protein [Saccharopolyspora spinosa]PKW13074.1 hypothetical protein A8926_0575 [Saccharopolyspora spinosa]
MTGTCAKRGPWSRLSALAVRAAFIGGLSISGWLGAAAVADAVELPENDHLRVEVEQIVLDPVGSPAPANPVPASPELASPELDPVRALVEKPEIEPPRIDAPAQPNTDPDQPAAVADETNSAPPVPPPPPLPVQQRTAAPTSDDQAAPRPKQSPVPDATVRIIPKPRGPDASAPSHVTPPTEPAPEPPVSPAPATTLSAGSTSWGGGLRGLLVILPADPSQSGPVSTGVDNRQTRPTTGILSFEPSKSPD